MDTNERTDSPLLAKPLETSEKEPNITPVTPTDDGVALTKEEAAVESTVIEMCESKTSETQNNTKTASKEKTSKKCRSPHIFRFGLVRCFGTI